MPNLQRGGACLNFAHFSMQFCNPGDPKGGPWPNVMIRVKNYDQGRHDDLSLMPNAQPIRRVPFQLREKADKKLNELMQAGIIEVVQKGPTTWISLLVVIPKTDGDI